MGWYGDYESSEEVYNELIEDIKREWQGEIIDGKLKKTYGAVLYRVGGDKVKIYYYIYNKSTQMYKPLEYIEGGNRIPKKWIKQVG